MSDVPTIKWKSGLDRFEIAVEIPVTVDMEKATAEYKDGFLMIVLPKSNAKQDEDG